MESDHERIQKGSLNQMTQAFLTIHSHVENESVSQSRSNYLLMDLKNKIRRKENDEDITSICSKRMCEQ